MRLSRSFGRRIVAAVCVLVVPTLCLGLPDGAANPPETCGECHRLDPLLSHPIGVTPAMLVPESLPLSDGQIACQTCHDVAGPGHVKAGPQLRLSAETLCRACHQAAGATRTGHGQNVRRAHLPASSPATPAADGLDPETRNCISCHDGSVAADATPVGTGRPYEQVRDHPVGQGYAPAVKTTRLVAPTLMDPRVRLIDGKVGCGSCHSPYSRQKSQLVMSNRESALCLSCHQR